MHTLLHDIRYGWRMLIKSKAFALVAVFTLALGIGANGAIFSVIHGVLLRPLPLPEPDELMTVWTDLPNFGIEEASVPDFFDWRAQNNVFEDMAAYRGMSLNLSGTGDPERLAGAATTWNLFRLMGVQPALGRDFTPEDDKPGAPRVAILSEKLWKRRFGGDPGILGKTIPLNGTPVTVIGLAPPDLGILRSIDVWVPLAAANNPNQRRNDILAVVGRLKPGVSPQQAQAQMTTLAASLARQYPATNTGVGIRVIPLHERMVGQIRTALLALWAAVGFVLLIVCANLANLVLARSASRHGEIAVRIALGAGRGRLVRQLLTESMLLASLGGVLGLLLAAWSIDVLTAMGTGNIPRIGDVGLNPAVLGFTAAVSLLTGVLFGVLPALQIVRPRLHEALKEGGRMAALLGGHNRLRRGLAVLEVALSLMLLVGAALMIRSFSQLTNVDPGFETRNLLTFRLVLPAARYNEPAKMRGFYQQAVERLRGLPGATAAEASTSMYIRDGAPILSFAIQGAPAPPPDQSPDADIRAISPGFHRMMGIRLLQGRHIGAEDTANAPLVATVNESFAKRYFAGQQVLGKRVAFDGDSQPRFREIVGIVRDVKQQGLEADVYPEIQVPYEQFPRPAITFAVRTSAPDPAQLTAAIRRELKSVDPELPLFAVSTGDEMLQQSVAERRFHMTLFGIFASIALVLAAVGIYGVMAQSVAQRTGEFGIRMALGARPADILRLVMKGGVVMTVAGLLAGTAGALLLTRFLSTMLFRVKATDPLTFVVVALVLGVVSLLACYLPARRATQVDPLVALRYE